MARGRAHSPRWCRSPKGAPHQRLHQPPRACLPPAYPRLAFEYAIQPFAKRQTRPALGVRKGFVAVTLRRSEDLPGSSAPQGPQCRHRAGSLHLLQSFCTRQQKVPRKAPLRPPPHLQCIAALLARHLMRCSDLPPERPTRPSPKRHSADGVQRRAVVRLALFPTNPPLRTDRGGAALQGAPQRVREVGRADHRCAPTGAPLPQRGFADHHSRASAPALKKNH